MKTLKLDTEKVNDLVAEYKADPNCWAELWIRGENVTEDERKLFIKLATKK
jgi:hypothetical protein